MVLFCSYDDFQPVMFFISQNNLLKEALFLYPNFKAKATEAQWSFLTSQNQSMIQPRLLDSKYYAFFALCVLAFSLLTDRLQQAQGVSVFGLLQQCHKLGGLWMTEIYCLLFWRLRSLRSRCRQIQYQVKAYFLVHRQPSSCFTSHGRRSKSSFWGLFL